MDSNANSLLGGLARGVAAGAVGTAVMTGAQLAYYKASKVELPAMGLAPPIWESDPKSLAPDVGFHVAYGAAVATAYKALS